MQKTPENEVSLIESIRNGLRSLKEAARLIEPIIKRIDDEELDDDFLTAVNEYGAGFSKVSDALDAIPIKDGEYLLEVSEDEKEQVDALTAELIGEVERLGENQEIITGGLKAFMEQNSHRLEVLRKARGIFDKFVKRPPQSPRFFDRKG